MMARVGRTIFFKFGIDPLGKTGEKSELESMNLSTAGLPKTQKGGSKILKGSLK